MGSQTPLRTEQALPPPDSTQYEVTCTSLLFVNDVDKTWAKVAPWTGLKNPLTTTCFSREASYSAIPFVPIQTVFGNISS